MPIAYKLFTITKKQKGKLFPLYINTNKPTPIGKWIEAETGERVNDKVKSKLGLLCYRPGWHLSDLPIAKHIGVKNDNGEIAFMKYNTVWCECEYSDDIDYQNEANENGTVNGKLISRLAYLKKIPVNGFYRFKTNPNMFGTWILAGAIKINRVLNDEEVNKILLDNNIEPMKRSGGDIILSDYGF